jgi:hypothetical protein
MYAFYLGIGIGTEENFLTISCRTLGQLKINDGNGSRLIGAMWG